MVQQEDGQIATGYIPVFMSAEAPPEVPYPFNILLERPDIAPPVPPTANNLVTRMETDHRQINAMASALEEAMKVRMSSNIGSYIKS